MNPIQAIILGVIEGLTEFFPISSTGHLIVAERLFHISNPSIVFNTVIQMGAIVAVMMYYWKRIRALFHQSFQKGGWIIPVRFAIGTLPVLVAGLVFHGVVESMHSNTTIVGLMSIAVALLMWWVQRAYKETLQSKKVAEVKDFLAIGLFQTVSIIPGVSRSGITILGGISRKLSFDQAVEISFLLGIPAMGAASVFELFQVMKNPIGFDANLLPLTVVGFVMAMLVAFLTLNITLPILKKYGFMPFIIYRIAMGVLLLLMFR